MFNPARVLKHQLKNLGRVIKQLKSWSRDEMLEGGQATIELTYRCNARCKFCDRWRHSEKKGLKELTLEDHKRIAEELKKAGISSVGFTGGEPAIRKDFREILSVYSGHEFSLHLNSNGSLLHKFIDQLVEYKVSVMVSIDGPNAKIHDELRGFQGLFAKAIENIKLLRKANVQVNIGANLTPPLLKKINEYFDLADNLGVNVRFNPLAENITGMFEIHDPTLIFKPGDRKTLESACRLIIEKMDNHKKLNWGNKMYYQLMPLFLTNPEKMSKIRCVMAARSLFFISPYGEVYPCELRRDIALGDLRKEDFSTIVDGKQAKHFRRYLRTCDKTCICWLRCSAPGNIAKQFSDRPLININDSFIKKKWLNIFRHLNMN